MLNNKKFIHKKSSARLNNKLKKKLLRENRANILCRKKACFSVQLQFSLYYLTDLILIHQHISYRMLWRHTPLKTFFILNLKFSRNFCLEKKLLDTKAFFILLLIYFLLSRCIVIVIFERALKFGENMWSAAV